MRCAILVACVLPSHFLRGLLVEPLSTVSSARALSYSTSFTLQVVPPADAQITVAYLVVEAGAHMLDGGTRLIAGESALSVDEHTDVEFRTMIEAEGESDSAFTSTPSLIYTLQGGDAGVRASCTESTESGFTLSLLAAPAARTQRGESVDGRICATSHRTLIGLPSHQDASEAEVRAAIVLQSQVRGRRIRRQLAGATRCALVGWVACDTGGNDGITSGMLPVAHGTGEDVVFSIDYPEAPLVLFAPVGDAASKSGTRAICSHLDDRSCTLALEEPSDSKCESMPAALPISWLAMPPGKLWSLAESAECPDHEEAGEGTDAAWMEDASATYNQEHVGADPASV